MFSRLPNAAVEACSVAKLLGGDTVLRLDKEAREAESKASPLRACSIWPRTDSFSAIRNSSIRILVGPTCWAAGTRGSASLPHRTIGRTQ